MGRDRLAAMVAELGEDAGAPALLERVSAQAGEVSDDMAACMVRAESGADVPRPRIEELEVDAAGARRPAISSFLAQCGLAQGEREAALGRLQATADESGGALLRVIVGDGPIRVEVDPLATGVQV